MDVKQVTPRRVERVFNVSVVHVVRCFHGQSSTTPLAVGVGTGEEMYGRRLCWSTAHGRNENKM